MKKVLFAILTGLAFSANAQLPKGLSIDLNLGTRLMGATSNDSISINPGLHIDGAVGYMLTDLYGVRGGLGMDTYKIPFGNGSQTDKSYMMRASLEGVLNVAKLAGYESEKIGTTLHAGFGWAGHFNPSYKETRDEWSDPMFKGADDMVNVIFGVSPKYSVTENISIGLDISYVLLFKKYYTNDWYNATESGGSDGILNTSVGITYKF